MAKDIQCTKSKFYELGLIDGANGFKPNVQEIKIGGGNEVPNNYR